MTPEEFWSQNEQYKDKKFYAGFCFLATSLNDYAVGRSLHRQNKLDWACTAYYYSLVHALRLVCFLVYGDFPTSHSKLAKMFKPVGGEFRSRNSIKGDWLRTLVNDDIGRELINCSLSITKISSEFSSVSKEVLERWGKILDVARELRNDSSYEGLLIAHQYDHSIVTAEFKKLTRLLRKACEDIIPQVIEIFREFIEKSDRKDHWYSYLNWEGASQEGANGIISNTTQGLKYIEDSLKSKLTNEEECEVLGEVTRWLGPLRLCSSFNEGFAVTVLNNIIIEEFSEKGKLMQEFKRRIEEFERVVRGNSNGR